MNSTRMTRNGFTLVELLVVMALIATLSAMVLLAAPGIMDKDRARDGATQLQGALQNARIRAMRDGVPRGVRLILDSESQTSGAAPFTYITASNLQYIEVPPWFLLSNQTGATTANGIPTPFLKFQYVYAHTTNVQFPAGSIKERICTIDGMSLGQFTQLQSIVNGPPLPQNYSPPTLGLPTISFWTTILPGTFAAAQSVNKNTNAATIKLSVYPDAQIGGANIWQTPTGVSDATLKGVAYFGIYQSPRPLLGEPTMKMPLNTSVDLSDGLTQPSFSNLYANHTTGFLPAQLPPGYDILFSPSGQMMNPTGIGQVYLWVRDPTKGKVDPASGTQLSYANPESAGNPFLSISPFQWPVSAPATNPSYTTPQWQSTLPTGGEQLLVTIRANSGGTGVTPVFWPTATNANPYSNAIYSANAP